MTINIELNQKSIQEAKKKLLQLKKTLPKLQQDFLMDVAHWITDRANTYIDNSDIGISVKSLIKSSWEYQQLSNGIKVINSANTTKKIDRRGTEATVPTAVLVEFGVGIVGSGDPHPQANAENYEYNIPNRAKFLGGYWSFDQSLNDLDLPLDSVDYEKSANGFVFLTQGSKGVWYAYNAIADAKMELARPNGGEIGALWEKAKRKYIK